MGVFSERFLKICVECGCEYLAKSGVQKFCSPSCKGKHPYSTGRITTDGQYEKISGNWKRYFQRLLYSPGREKLRINDLLELAEQQNYRCALSGEELTCQLGRGMTFMTNASIDRIIPGSEYTKDNIRLVCRIVNIMKWNMTDDKLKEWCKRILDGTKGS
jgi:hypothetical protein